VLVVLYALVRAAGIKLPLKPFFTGTSALLFLMSIAFAGKGVKALQAANMIPVTILPFGFVTVDLMGIYPTLETLIPQIVLLAVTVVTFVM
jgi:high-affinity iron transporter